MLYTFLCASSCGKFNSATTNPDAAFDIGTGGGVFYSILQIPFTGAYFCNEIISFYLIYVIIAYIKKYTPVFILRRNICILTAVISTVIYFMGAMLLNYLGIYISYFSDKMYIWRQMNNPLIIIFAISMFLVCKRIKIQSNLINKISSLSFIIYLVHENPLVNKYLKAVFWNEIYTNLRYENILVYIIAFSLMVFNVGATIAYIYQRLFKKIVDKMASYVNELTGKVIITIMKYVMMWK